jgi:2-polyprenyl-3-methyl-5-hydroxy-6-metoxy-1,4-benzoquinol methylase/uncharacterized protein YbaR (Trm112 family)
VRRSLLKILSAPKTAESLTLYTFESDSSRLDEEENISEGILLSSTRAYPVIDGVPVMLDSAFTEEFLNRHATRISQVDTLSKLHLRAERNSHWSFSSEWEEHFNYQLDRTWGWSVDERIRQFLLEADVDRNWCEGKLILDAGCGNGQLSEGLTALGATVVALDYSVSVFRAEKYRKSYRLHFVQGDLQNPPFDTATFDVIISNGVLHHTPNTYKTFIQVSKLVKPGGRFYLWLYRKSEKFFRRYFFYPPFELTRTIVSRMPKNVQKPTIKVYALALLLLHRVLRKHKDLLWPERVVAAYDNLTPLWRHYHTPLEVSCWFFLNGFSSPSITHWDNPYGFGMVAKKKTQDDTPGVNFGKARIGKRYWK